MHVLYSIQITISKYKSVCPSRLLLLAGEFLGVWEYTYVSRLSKELLGLNVKPDLRQLSSSLAVLCLSVSHYTDVS